MAIYRTLVPVHFLDTETGTVVEITQAGRLVELNDEEAALLEGSITAATGVLPVPTSRIPLDQIAGLTDAARQILTAADIVDIKQVLELAVGDVTGATSVDAWALAVAANPDQIATGTITRSATGAAIGFSVSWPDGATGTFTGTESTAFPGAIDSYVVTRVKGSTAWTFTQPTLTRDSSGVVTNRPAIVRS